MTASPNDERETIPRARVERAIGRMVALAEASPFYTVADRGAVALAAQFLRETLRLAAPASADAESPPVSAVTPGSEPSQPLDQDTVRRIARLARIHLDDAEVAQFQRDLNGIFGWIAQLNEVDVTNVQPLHGVVGRWLGMLPLASPINERLFAAREDVVTEGNIPNKILANAPDHADGFFAVPKVVE